jgi:hypothetical protein
MRAYGLSVAKLQKNEVFVFGSNWDGKRGGFHGAGAAGFASFGVSGNRWREFDYDRKPNGWQGKWNVKGVGEGLQAGTEGTSYALPIVTRPGAKRSLTHQQIVENIRKMYVCASANPGLRFLVAGSKMGSQPLCGYTHDEICSMYVEAGPIPSNVFFSDSYAASVSE